MRCFKSTINELYDCCILDSFSKHRTIKWWAGLAQIGTCDFTEKTIMAPHGAKLASNSSKSHNNCITSIILSMESYYIVIWCFLLLTKNRHKISLNYYEESNFTVSTISFLQSFHNLIKAELNIDYICFAYNSWNLLVHGIGAKLLSNWEQNMLYTKS